MKATWIKTSNRVVTEKKVSSYKTWDGFNKANRKMKQNGFTLAKVDYSK